MLGTGVVVIIANASKGQAPKPRAVLGLGFVYMALAALGDFAPKLAAPFAALVFVGTLLTEGAPALDAVANAVTGVGQLGLGDAGGGGLGSSSTTSSIKPGPATPGDVGPGTATGRDLLAGAKAKGAVSWAERVLGVPYFWGGNNPQTGFDCSGLTQWAYAHVGVALPHFAASQQTMGQDVTPNELLPGDLIFQGRPAHHVVMYVGGGKVIQAPHTGARVSYDGADYYIQTDPGGCRRIVPALASPGPHPPK